MKKISQIPYKEIEINFLEEKGFLGYSFGFNGKNYGVKVETKSKRKDLIEATALLIINAIQSYENLSNKPTRKRTTTSKPVSNNKGKSK